ncbi:MAG: SRPBCC domain-containing protein [Pseudomonadota bacterium]
MGEPLAVSRTIAASPATIFAAFTRAETLARWFAPTADTTLDILTLEFREGGAFHLRFTSPDGRSVTARGTYTAIAPDSRIACSWRWEAPHPLAGTPTTVTFTFRPEGDATVVTITQTGLPPSTAGALHASDWHLRLARLATLTQPSKGATMRSLATLTFVSLDGVMQGVSGPEEDPSGGFTRGGWAAPYWEDVMAQVMQEAMAEPYDMLFGATTYGLFAESRPAPEQRGPIDEMMNTARKYVVSSKLAETEWENTTPIDGPPEKEVARLKRAEGPLLQIHGSWQLIQALLAADLIDEFRLWVFPVILGAGKRLFPEGTPPQNLRLARSAPAGNGVQMLIYQREPGAFAGG